jgi:hypothetical protein
VSVEADRSGLERFGELRRLFDVTDERCLTKDEMEALQDALDLAYQLRVRADAQKQRL